MTAADPGEAVGAAGTHPPINLHRELAAVLAGVGLPEDTGATVHFSGSDPVLASPLPIASAAAVAMAARHSALTSLWNLRTGGHQDINIDLRTIVHSVGPFHPTPHITLNGYPPAPDDPGNPLDFTFWRTGDDRFVMAYNSYPRLRDRAFEVLGCRSDRRSVAAAVARWTAAELEEALQDNGAVCSWARTPVEWQAEPQAAFVEGQPLVEIERIGEGPARPLAPGTTPLAGIRALGVAHVLAGPALGAALAEQGADVLNVWSPRRHEPQRTYLYANAGLRSTTLDVAEASGRSRFDRLLTTADVFFTNLRRSAAERLGLDAAATTTLRPGLIHVSFSCFGEEGPWRDRVGFDPQALSVAGLTRMERGDEPRLPPTLVFNDFVSAWLAATAVLATIRRRTVEGGSWRVHVNLTRVAAWLRDLGLQPSPPDVPDTRRPVLRTARTPLGVYQFVPPQVELSMTPPCWDPVLVPRGSCNPRWLESQTNSASTPPKGRIQ